MDQISTVGLRQLGQAGPLAGLELGLVGMDQISTVGLRRLTFQAGVMHFASHRQSKRTKSVRWDCDRGEVDRNGQQDRRRNGPDQYGGIATPRGCPPPGREYSRRNGPDQWWDCDVSGRPDSSICRARVGMDQVSTVGLRHAARTPRDPSPSFQRRTGPDQYGGIATTTNRSTSSVESRTNVGMGQISMVGLRLIAGVFGGVVAAQGSEWTRSVRWDCDIISSSSS